MLVDTILLANLSRHNSLGKSQQITLFAFSCLNIAFPSTHSISFFSFVYLLFRIKELKKLIQEAYFIIIIIINELRLKFLLWKLNCKIINSQIVYFYLFIILINGVSFFFLKKKGTLSLLTLLLYENLWKRCVLARATIYRLQIKKWLRKTLLFGQNTDYFLTRDCSEQFEIFKIYVTKLSFPIYIVSL